jgi:AmmeMemoRadiSam system protein B
MTPTVRPPAVAGRFYPGDPHVLLAAVQSFLSPKEKTTPALGCVVPHAGYIYSGHVAGAVFAELELPQRFIILCPNHTGRGTPLSIMSQGSWQTPLGQAVIDAELAEKLKRQFPLLSDDAEAHRAEHAIEVELPFLQALKPGFAFVPIVLGTGQFRVLEELGIAIADTVGKERILIVASSDMNHYENDSVTRVKDRMAIDRILALDAAGLHEVVTKEKISMCGLGPTVAMLTAARRLGATSAELVKYATSGDVSGDRDIAVGYAGVVVR